MIDRMNRDLAFTLAGGFALGTQWGFILLKWAPAAIAAAWLALGCLAGFAYVWAYGNDLAASIKRKKRQDQANADYPPMEM